MLMEKPVPLTVITHLMPEKWSVVGPRGRGGPDTCFPPGPQHLGTFGSVIVRCTCQLGEAAVPSCSI